MRREHQRPRGGEQIDALVAQQLADVDDVRPGVEVERQQRPRDRVLVARERRLVVRTRRRRQQIAGDRPQLRLGLRQRPRCEDVRVDPWRAKARARKQAAIVEQLDHPLAMCPEPTSSVAARAIPSRAAGTKRAGAGAIAYSRSEPWTFTAYGTSGGRPRAAASGPKTRWLTSARSGCRRPAIAAIARALAAT